MPKIVVEIEWDKPREPMWLCPDNIALVLSRYCKKTKFKVREVRADLRAATPAEIRARVAPRKKRS